MKAGGFKGVYRGLGIVSAGSIPGSAIFFTIYEGIRRQELRNKRLQRVKNDFVAPAMGEIGACTVRVPVEVVKQRCQATAVTTSRANIDQVMRTEGLSGFYRGFGVTIMREIPFAVIQFPIWEYCKQWYAKRYAIDRKLGFFESGFCGAIAGGIAAALTTPIDVAKTRIMLSSEKDAEKNVLKVMSSIYREEGPHRLLSGIGPRVFWITIGGFIYLGTLEKIKNVLAQ